jgi:hypothetical protein
MSRKVLSLLVLLLLSLPAVASSRTLAHRQIMVNHGTVSGTVSGIEGNLLRLADGLIVIDAAGAKIVVGHGSEATLNVIEPGMLIFAVIAADDTAAGAPLRASMITAPNLGDATLMGTISSVDSQERSFVLLGRTMFTDDDTSFGGYRHGAATDFSDLAANMVASVQADVVDGRLVAREILVVTPVPVHFERLRGEVRSIGTDAWTVDVNGVTETIVVNAQTRIAGSPKVGDIVEVLFRVDASNQKVAISILRFERPAPPSGITQFQGVVKAIEAGTWTITVDAEDRQVIVNDRTIISPNTGVGDRVQVMAIRNADGTLTAVMVMKLRR